MKGKLNSLLMGAIIMGGGLPGIKMSESNTRMDNLPEGFKEHWFNRDTGEIITDEQSRSGIPKEVNVFRVTSRSEENAIKEFKRLTT